MRVSTYNLAENACYLAHGPGAGAGNASCLHGYFGRVCGVVAPGDGMKSAWKEKL